MNSDNTNRFTDTVENYIKYRPLYPPEMYPFLVEHCGLTQAQTIADIGSGTGFLSKLFLDQGHIVYGVEPNDAMRLAGEQYL
ncbi:MAG: class I SAM-dependent methyltransferase, partial [Proteobacteria bacterium]|nr:class I SAM-dependent methyltransferase [Pseudomonadota bacterium]